jgi:hypothetical protein
MIVTSKFGRQSPGLSQVTKKNPGSAQTPSELPYSWLANAN